MTVWEWPGSTIPNVLDGDTLDARVTRTVVMDFGFGLHPEQTLAPVVRMRLNRINASPAYTTLGKAATAMVRQLTAGVVVHVTTLGAYKYGGPPDSPGEWMAEVTLPDGTNLADTLVTAGLAVYWSGQGPRPGG